ncbi:MAG: hypothetical protein PUE13_03185 [Clostridiales bacterium]|nr:hypothetical protein [Clostridiales bacterium]
MKKNFVKLAAMAMAAVMSVGVLAACGATADNTNTEEVEIKQDIGSDKTSEKTDTDTKAEEDVESSSAEE